MKKVKRTPLQLFSLVLLISLLSGACRKKETPEPEPPVTEDTEQSTATENSTTESFMADVESFGSEVSENGSLSQSRESAPNGITAAACATVSGYGTKTITVDFGTACLGQDGRTRSGKLIYDFSASSPSTAVYYRNPGFNMKVTSQNYVVDGYSVTISNKNVVNTSPTNLPSGLNPGTNLTWAVTASVSIVKPNNGGMIQWNCNRTKELTNTSDTTCYRGQSKAIVWKNAIVKLNGTATGVNARNENYTTLGTNLIRDFKCTPDALRPARHPFISGTLQYTPGSRRVRILNYGSNTCDLNAVLTVGTQTHAVVLN